MINTKIDIYPEGKNKHEAKNLPEKFKGQLICCTVAKDGLVNIRAKTKTKEFEDGSYKEFKAFCDEMLKDKPHYVFYCFVDGGKKFLGFLDGFINPCEPIPQNMLGFADDLCLTGHLTASDISIVYVDIHEEGCLLQGYSFNGFDSFVLEDILFHALPYDEFIKRHHDKQLAPGEKRFDPKEVYKKNIESLKEFLKKCSFSDFYDKISEEVVGQSNELGKACATVYRYFIATTEGKEFNGNFIITAPSGCGKTQFFRSVRNVVNIEYKCTFPIIQCDVSNITATGYKGNDFSVILEMLLVNGSGMGEGLVFLDEFDKKLIATDDSSLGAFNAMAQSNLLTMVEGSTVAFECKKQTYTLNTRLTLFVGLGAFQSIRKEKVDAANKKGIGFGAVNENNSASDMYSDIDFNDIINCGGMQELVGRFRQVINFHRLSDDDYIDIIKKYVKEYPLFIHDTKMRISNRGAKDFLKFANSDMGVREIYRRIEETIMPHIVTFMKWPPKGNSAGIIEIDGYMNAECEGCSKQNVYYTDDELYEYMNDYDDDEEDYDDELFQPAFTPKQS